MKDFLGCKQLAEYELQEVKIYLETERYQHALEKLIPLIVEDPDSGELYYLMACIYLGLDQYQEALNYCTEALCNEHPAGECYLLQGRIYLELKWYAEAEQGFMAALHENPKNAEALAMYGYAMLKTGHERKAKELLEKGFKEEPTNRTLLRYYFYYYLFAAEHEELWHRLERYWLSPSREVRQYMAAGVAELAQENYLAARKNFHKVYRLEPGNGDMAVLIQALSEASSPLYLPHRLVQYLGGALMVWMGAITLVLGLERAGYREGAAIVAVTFSMLAIYYWVIRRVERVMLTKEGTILVEKKRKRIIDMK